MFEVGFTEILLIMVIALVVLGPERLPKLAADVGRWMGRARSMARQLRSQLDQEVQLEDMLRGQERSSSASNPGTYGGSASSSGGYGSAGAAAAGTAAAGVAATTGTAAGTSTIDATAPSPAAPVTPGYDPALHGADAAIGAPTDEPHQHLHEPGHPGATPPHALPPDYGHEAWSDPSLVTTPSTPPPEPPRAAGTPDATPADGR